VCFVNIGGSAKSDGWPQCPSVRTRCRWLVVAVVVVAATGTQGGCRGKNARRDSTPPSFVGLDGAGNKQALGGNRHCLESRHAVWHWYYEVFTHVKGESQVPAFGGVGVPFSRVSLRPRCYMMGIRWSP